MSSIRIKAKERKGSVDVKTLMKHNMETGLRKNKDGSKIPEHWITDVTAESAERLCSPPLLILQSRRIPISLSHSRARRAIP
jgi:hypothetical protein